jgi:flagellar basal-body rod protein FlgB
MEGLQLFGLAARQADWLAARQATIARNVANANTPAFRPSDLPSFASVLDRTRLDVAKTDKAHLPISPVEARPARARAADGWETTISGNAVSLEQEMAKVGEINRGYALNSGIAKAFQRMLLSSVKG